MNPSKFDLLQILVALLCAVGMLATALLVSDSQLSETVSLLLVSLWLVPSSLLAGGSSLRREWRCLRRRLGLKPSD